MPNLVITTACNRACSYCFAGRRSRDLLMAAGQARRVIDIVRNSGMEEVRLLGGEPTLHPEFEAILAYAINQGLYVQVFTNGFMPPSALEALRKVPVERCRVVMNVPVGDDRRTNGDRILSRAARLLGEKVTVAVNIYRPGMPLHEASRFVDQHRLSRSIRVGLAHPRLDRINSFLHPRNYHRIGKELELWLNDIKPRKFKLSFDCGFVPCMFSPTFMEMAEISVDELGSRCNAIPDILPDLTAVHCLPLAELDQLPIHGVGTIGRLRDTLQCRTQVFRKAGVFRECPTCHFWQRSVCGGGCVSASMLRSRGEPKTRGSITVSLDEATSVVKPKPTAWAIPYIDQPLNFWHTLVTNHGAAIREVYFPICVPGVGSGRPVQPDEHLPRLLDARIVPMSVLVNPFVLQQPLETVAPRIIEKLLRLHEEKGVAAATLSNSRLAEQVRDRIPAMRLTASCLLDVSDSAQARTLRGLFDVLVPATRVIRDLRRIRALREAFGGTVRLLVNEGCLADCLDRKQHMYEITAVASAPESLCARRIERAPWLRLTGAWVLPQHLHLYDGVVDEYKLAGRVTLRNPWHYRSALNAYLHRTALWPSEIGGGPASVLQRWSVPQAAFEYLLQCSHVCADCTVCKRIAQGQQSVESSI